MAKRPRAINFDNDELELLTQLCEQHKDIINSKLTNSKTNEDKKKIWSMMAEEISALGKSKRTAECVKTKWANTASEAKRKFSDIQIYKRGTWGGPPPKQLNPIMEKVVDLYKDSVAFTGLEGVEAPPPPSDSQQQHYDLYTVTEDLHGRHRSTTYTSPISQDTEDPQPPAPRLVSLPPSPPLLVPRPQSPTQIMTEATCSSIQADAPLLQLHRPTQRPVRPQKKVTSADLQQMQYEVTTYYELVNHKIRKELGRPTKDTSTNTV